MPPFIVPRPLGRVEYEEAASAASDIICGPEVELSKEDQEHRRQRIQAHANSYLKGRDIIIASANLKGPFDGTWSNPWLEKAGTRDSDSTQQDAQPEFTEEPMNEPSHEARSESDTLVSTLQSGPTLRASAQSEVGTVSDIHHLSPFDEFYRPANTNGAIPIQAAAFYLPSAISAHVAQIKVGESRPPNFVRTRKSLENSTRFCSTICGRSNVAQAATATTKTSATGDVIADEWPLRAVTPRHYRPQTQLPLRKLLPKPEIGAQSPSDRHSNGPLSNTWIQSPRSLGNNFAIESAASLPHEVQIASRHQEPDPPPYLCIPPRKPGFRLGDLLEPDSSPEPQKPTFSSRRDRRSRRRQSRPPEAKASSQKIRAPAADVRLNAGEANSPQPHSSETTLAGNDGTPSFTPINAPQRLSLTSQALARTDTATYPSPQWTPINAPRARSPQLPPMVPQSLPPDAATLALWSGDAEMGQR